MNHSMLSTDIKVIETEIKMYKENMGRSLWEIGRRLNYVKEQDLAHGEFLQWLDSIGMERRKANRMMRIAKELAVEETTLSHLGISALELIASLPEDLRLEPQPTMNGEVKSPVNMTVAELKQIKNRDRIIDKKIQYPPKNKEPAFDSEGNNQQIHLLQNELSLMRGKFNQLNQQYEDVLKREGKSKRKANQLDQIKNHINENINTLEPGVVHMANSFNFTEFKNNIDDLLLKISPIRYQTDFTEIDRNSDTYNQYLNVIERVNDWCNDMFRMLNQPVIIDGNFSEDV